MTSELGAVTRALASRRFFQMGSTLYPAPNTLSEPLFMPSVLINGNARDRSAPHAGRAAPHAASARFPWRDGFLERLIGQLVVNLKTLQQQQNSRAEHSQA